MHVRALYDYDADDRTSLSFHEGDIIQVITRLESGWWDGIINGVRGWFPSNYCQLITDPTQLPDDVHVDTDLDDDLDNLDDPDTSETIESDLDDAHLAPDDHHPDTLPFGAESFGAEHTRDRSRADFWIPQATADGRLFYFNTETGESCMELPLESPGLHETGPPDRMHVNLPDKTDPPPEIMSPAYMPRDEEEEEAAGAAGAEEEEEVTSALSPATSIDSINMAAFARSRGDMSSSSISAVAHLPGPSTTSFISPLPPGPATPFSTHPTSATAGAGAAARRSFFDNAMATPLTWQRLTSNMQQAITLYKQAIQEHRRADYVRRAEDISDHLRLLLAAGSGTTDNHSGQPSIISTNKALYPHFRDMMSKFSKLVISSHIAAADWPTADSAHKCLIEADGVLTGVYSYIDIARQQRGEVIPRLLPGFVLGSTVGGNWQSNGTAARDPMTMNFLDEDEMPAEPSATLDTALLDQMGEMKRVVTASLRKLEEQLVLTDSIITPYRHEVVSTHVCTGAQRVLEAFRLWMAAVESVNLAPLGPPAHNTHVQDLAGHKQSLYDDMSDLVLACQAVAAPLGDEWSEWRGEPLEGRLHRVRQGCRALETTLAQASVSLQRLGEQLAQAAAQTAAASERVRDGKRSDSLPFHRRDDSRTHLLRPALGGLGQSQSFSEGDTAPYRKTENSKVRKFFGEEPQPPESPECLKLDHEDDICYDTKTTPPQLKGGTLLALVEQLTRHDKLDSNFNNTFLLTYRSFTSARELFTLLVKRFQVQPPEGMSTSDYETWRDRKQKPIRFRVVNILKSWMDNFWMEDQSDETKGLIRDVYTFARDTVKTTETPGSGPLMTVLEQRLRGQEATAKRLVMTLNTATPQPIMPRNMKKLKFLDIDVTEFARQLTIMESKLYGKIKPTECLNKTWQKKVGENDAEPAPNVKALILQSNQLTNWVAEMILTQVDPRKRVIVIKHFVAVADKCRQLNNFSTLTSIISALGTAPIHRLKRTWDIVPSKTISTLDAMRRLMLSNKNFGEYRESLHLANPPCIPFFGIYLTDLTFIEDGIPSIIKKTNLVNFAKRAKTAEVIRDIQQYQNVPYSLQSVPELQEYILTNMQAAGDVHEMYERSLQVEPREREDEKIVRVLAESGFL